MPEFYRNFKKTVWGFAVVTADSVEEANTKIEEGGADDEVDNQSEYEWEGDAVLNE